MKYGVENTTYSTADGNYTPYKQRYAWMVSISAGCALFCVTSSRYIGRNKQTPLATKNLLEVTDGLRRPPLEGEATQSISDLSMR